MSDNKKYFIIGFLCCAIIWLIIDSSNFKFNENSEEIIVTVNTTEDIDGFNFEVENYISGNNNKLNLKKFINDYEDHNEFIK